MLRIIRNLFVLVVILSGLALHLRNDQPVLFDYYLASVELPFSLFMVLALSLGVLIGILVGLPLLISLKREKDRLLSRLRVNEKELDNLRVMPAKNPY